VYSTYLGGSDEDSGTGIALDSARNIYVTGITQSGNFPTSPNPAQESTGTADVFIQISPPPTLARDLTIESFEAEINGYSDDQDQYNGALAALDEQSNELDKRERRLADLNQRITSAVRGHFGPDSNEFEQVGGVRRSDRKRPVRTPKPVTTN
jgi:hypothetical protein